MLWCDIPGCIVWGCCVCVRCGSFSDAFGSAGGTASVACSVYGHEVGEKADLLCESVNALPSIYDLFDPSLLPSEIARLASRSPQSRRVVMKLVNKMRRGIVAVNEVGEIVEKGLSVAGLMMEDVVLPPAAIALAALEEKEGVKE
ncbi:uncharacterized protein MONOS_11433 [Monocercomonoides exilis]|uniref:uncharacterized protein n=1 Tax=Monocercomonoides exilis TaxID=2049356 RepID=UPI0035595C81|nr:hypothetical protein MONOS_11433 [Monocercomonoides exilis]|eukprot:MONOS_11433.1-p1 / transcript=MONOS_11433.1 / gene=MONOS_11433 / organism=Monocercomonoides_exilis_PA203 / gene_product=unspecified product / transcript_product=unspecified product / location=Mono_scaffold00573:32978-33412(-) / protein_length=145 / sequence_SO=supercontig / SO=protein_coding / is_pseudo=false